MSLATPIPPAMTKAPVDDDDAFIDDTTVAVEVLKDKISDVATTNFKLPEAFTK